MEFAKHFCLITIFGRTRLSAKHYDDDGNISLKKYMAASKREMSRF